MRTSLAVITFAVAAFTGVVPVVAAQTVRTVEPGMTREQVIATLGEPLSTRRFQGHTYLLFQNGCEKKCGMNDLVVLDSGKVVDAIFRSPARHYSGTSSSPRMISTSEARREGRSARSAKLGIPLKKSVP